MKLSRGLPRRTGTLLAGMIFLSVVWCSVLVAVEPVPARAIYNTFTDQEEMQMGRKAAEETDKQLPMLDSTLLLAYLNDVGQRIVKASRRPDIQYTFKIVNTDTVNAFSLPGGYVYVHRGLLDFVTNESELAGILGHEVGHIAAYHSMNDVARRYWVQRGMYQLKEAGMLNNQQMTDLLEQFGGPILLFADRKFSREEESEADMLGMYNAIRAGYDPQGLISVLARLANFTGNPSLVESLLMNHPLPGERVKALRAELKEHPAPPGLEKDSLAFRAMKAQLKMLPPPPPPPKKAH